MSQKLDYKKIVDYELRNYFPNKEGLELWYNTPNKLFLDGKTPRFLIENGRGDDVVKLIELALKGYK